MDTMVDAIPYAVDSIRPIVKHSRSVSGYIILKTCNRLEVYIDISSEDVLERIESTMQDISNRFQRCDMSFLLRGEDSVRHLFEVCSGLDSLIVGEDQIQGQVREAYMSSKALKTTTPELNKVFDFALRTGKRVRCETSLNEGAVSIGSAAVKLSEECVGDLRGRSVAIIGSGEMSQLIGRCLKDKGVGATVISSRTHAHAVELANDLGGIAIAFEDVYDVVARSDIVLVATSAPHPIIKHERLRSIFKKDSETLIIDISVPRNVDPSVAEIEHITLKTLESLKEIADRNANGRRKESERAVVIVNDEIGKYRNGILEGDATAVIKDINNKIASIRGEEIRVAMNRINASNDIESVIEDFSNALLSRILADTYERLKEASKEGDEHVCRIAMELFGLED